jgi:hypothetical protein
VVNEGGAVLANRNVPNGVEPILSVIGTLPAARRRRMRPRSAGGWLLELLEDHGFEPHMVHPLQCKAIASARLKNDKVDAAEAPRPPVPSTRTHRPSAGTAIPWTWRITASDPFSRQDGKPRRGGISASSDRSTTILNRAGHRVTTRQLPRIADRSAAYRDEIELDRRHLGI